ncbi:MAG: hydrogenase expression protein HypE [Geminicoccaceae bacterium]
MSTLVEILSGLPALPEHHPWPRYRVTAEVWEELGRGMAEGRFDLMALFGDAAEVHLVAFEPETTALAVASLACSDGRFPSLGRLHAPAIRLERTIADQWGLQAEGAVDTRPWLRDVPGPYAFLPVGGEGLHQIPVGPIHAGIIEPGHFRFTANGETVVRLEERLGWVHKGIERLAAGADLETAGRLIGRVSGDSTVAYATAFARAAEAAVEVEAPPRAVWLRALMGELERIAQHLNDIGFVCNDAAFAVLHAHFGILREELLQLCDGCFGHRMMMDRVQPGGVAVDLDPESARRIAAFATALRPRVERLVKAYDETPSLQDRTVGTGHLAPALARRFAAGGHVGRASGRAFDSRKVLAQRPYDVLRFEVPVLEKGDVDARVWIRIREVRESLSLIAQILDGLPEGPIRVELPRVAGEGLGVAEAFRGDVLVWLALEGEGRVRRCHPRDPSWFQWPLLEAAIEGNIVADFPLCNKSFNCSYAGHDL